jgi:hypothetical protein
MNLASLDLRNTEARRRIKQAAAELGEALGVPPLTHPTAIEQRQPAVAQMRELECLALYLEAIVESISTNTEIYHVCPDCNAETVLSVGVTTCSGCGKPLELVQTA